MSLKSAQPTSALQRLAERGKADCPPPSTSDTPTAVDADSGIRIVVLADAIVVTPADLVDDRNFEGFDGNRVPQRGPTARGGLRGWARRHGRLLWHIEHRSNDWLCRCYHQHRIPGAAHDV